MDIKKGPDAFPTDRQLTRWVHFVSDQIHQSDGNRALRIVRESKMSRPANREALGVLWRQAAKQFREVRPNPATFWIYLVGVVTHEKKERLRQSFVDNVAEWSAIDVDARLAARVVVAELQGFRAPQRVPERSQA